MSFSKDGQGVQCSYAVHLQPATCRGDHKTLNPKVAFGLLFAPIKLGHGLTMWIMRNYRVPHHSNSTHAGLMLWSHHHRRCAKKFLVWGPYSSVTGWHSMGDRWLNKYNTKQWSIEWIVHIFEFGRCTRHPSLAARSEAGFHHSNSLDNQMIGVTYTEWEGQWVYIDCRVRFYNSLFHGYVESFRVG